MKKKWILIINLSMSCIFLHSQNSKINLGMDFSYGTHYYRSNITNPFFGSLSLGYEFVFCQYFGMEAGVKGGGFFQNVEYGYDEYKQTFDVYKGSSYAFFISPKLYYPIDYNTKKGQMHYLFLENRFSRSHTQISMNKLAINNNPGNKQHFTYEIKGGYEFPLAENWNLRFWLGYSSFDFGIVNPDIEFKTSTPLQLGVGFSYILSKRNF